MVRPSESKLVGRLFAFEFFQGSAIALFFTAAVSIFLKHRPTSDLPEVFILAAILLWAFGFLYSKLEHSLPLKKIIPVILVFNILLIVSFRLLMGYQEEQWFLYLLLGSFNILYLLNNLEFWGLAAVLFDVRQSKRVFGIISAGDIPAKMLGYVSAILLVPIIGTENLLWVSAGMLGISFFQFPSLLRVANLEAHPPKDSHSSVHDIAIALTGNKLIRQIALVSYFSFACFIVVNFVFYGYIKNEFQNDKELAGFFAVFFAIVRGITLILKLAGTNRLVDRIGLRKSLLISPLILLLVCGVTIYLSFQPISNYALYMFGMMAVIADVLRSAMQSPVLLSAMQPLPTHQRLRGHTIVKGLMDPFAFFSMGVVLWFLPSLQNKTDFSVIAILLMALITGWLLSALTVERNYLKTLQAAIRNRTLNERHVTISDTDSLEFLLNKLSTGSETEAISVLQLVSQQVEDRPEFLSEAIRHPSQHVRQFALGLIRRKKVNELLPQLMETLDNGKEDLAETIRTISSLNPSFDLGPFLRHHDKAVVYVAARISLKKKHDVPQAEGTLNELLYSDQVVDKVNALKLIGELKLTQYSGVIQDLFDHTDEQIKKAAFESAAKLGNEDLSNQLMNKFDATSNDKDILEAILKGDSSLAGTVKSYLNQHKCQGVKSRKLLALLGKMGGEKSVSVLDECLVKFPENADLILVSLHQANIHGKESKQRYKTFIHENLLAASQILFKINFARHKNGQLQLVEQALELELSSIRDKCLWLFSFLYDSGTIAKARAGFELNTRHSIANAIELIQHSVPKEFAILFCSIYENNTIEDKCMHLRKMINDSTGNESALARSILFDVDFTFNSWTKACVLYSLRDKELLSVEFIEPFRHSGSNVLKETAQFVISQRTGAKGSLN